MEPKTRRRGEELERAILDAAWEELTEVGYSAFTIEAVAARAATSKPVIYRRWPNRAKLMLAAWQQHVPRPQKLPDTGNLRSDLIALFTLVATRMQGMISEVIAGVMGEAFRHPEVAGALREQLREASPLSGAIQQLVARAVERGEFPPVDVPARATRMPLDLIRNELTLCDNTVLAPETIGEIVDEIFLPLLYGLAAAPPPASGGDQ
ncbi:TetR/AcrR family transcriptional regulator [Amycolatopsis pigmentata]|uniref:TetR/AcrR family transcriptional regulator n=1 Tax=Amycolatopsis pigmentata TaxID=450801 RepID=A0ABW5G1J8_9PSEU